MSTRLLFPSCLNGVFFSVNLAILGGDMFCAASCKSGLNFQENSFSQLVFTPFRSTFILVDPTLN